MAMAPSKTAQAAGENQPTTANAPATIRPELFMAARRGHSEQLKHLLDVEDAEAPAQPTAVPGEFIVDVDRPALSGALPLDGVTIEGDSVLHIVAASGDVEEFLECAKMIYGKAKHLLDARNNKGDTPLHCAAGAGNINMISCLVALATDKADDNDERVKGFLRRQNESRETALHQAVRSGNKDSMDLLMSMDLELACVPKDGGSSPLYLAISLGKVEIARYLFDKTNNLSYSGPGGQNILHAAIPRGKALPILLEWCKDQTVQIQEGERHRSVALLSHLTNQRDKNGSTPLHLAASLDGWPRAEFLSKWFPHDWPNSSKTTTLLLVANESMVYQPDNEGLYPIHVAASNGSLKVVKILLERCPGCATLRDRQGRTFLHVAVEKKKCSVVKYACGTPEFASILNVQDNNGDTALHRAVHVENLDVFNCLIRNQQNPISNVIKDSLDFLGASYGDSRPDHFYEKHIPKRDDDKDAEDITNATQVMGIVSVLVATVTFAAAFTLPGGYRADDHANGGTPTLAGSKAFDTFIIFDTLALIFSTLATFSLVFAGVPGLDLSIRRRYFNLSALLVRNSFNTFMVAFALGLYVVLAPVAQKIASFVFAFTISTFLYGNFELWQVIKLANTVRARHGILTPAARVLVLQFLLTVLLNFWPFVITFSLVTL